MTEKKTVKRPKIKRAAGVGDSAIRKTAKKTAVKVSKKAIKPITERTLVSFDYAVKYMLRGKSDFVVLNGFLTELMGKKVEVKAILESENNKADSDSKTNRVDLKAQINGGEFVVFEIQFLQEYDFFGKVLFGVSNAVVEQISSGKQYDIKKVHSINIAYSNLNAKREYLFSGKFGGFQGVHYKDEKISFAQAGNSRSKKTVDIHPEYYLILPNMFDEKLRSRFDEWVYVLKNSAVRDDFKAAGIQEAKRKLDYLKMPPDKRKDYERYMENRRSADSVVLTAEGKGWQRGLRKGRKEGLQEGIQKGRQEAIVETVRKMHRAGFSIAQIVKGLGLSAQKVKDLLSVKKSIPKT